MKRMRSRHGSRGPKPSLAKRAVAGTVMALVTVALVAVPASADPAGAPNNTGTGQSTNSNGSNGTDTASGEGGSSHTNGNSESDRNPIVVAHNTPPTQQTVGGTPILQGNVYAIQNSYGNARPDKPANDPWNPTVVRSALTKCDFRSGTHNLEDTRAMFPDRCGESWSPYLHRCDYSTSGWRCASL